MNRTCGGRLHCSEKGKKCLQDLRGTKEGGVPYGENEGREGLADRSCCPRNRYSCHDVYDAGASRASGKIGTARFLCQLPCYGGGVCGVGACRRAPAEGVCGLPSAESQHGCALCLEKYRRHEGYPGFLFRPGPRSDRDQRPRPGSGSGKLHPLPRDHRCPYRSKTSLLAMPSPDFAQGSRFNSNTVTHVKTT